MVLLGGGGGGGQKLPKCVILKTLLLYTHKRNGLGGEIGDNSGIFFLISP